MGAKLNITYGGLGAESKPPEAKGGLGAKLPAAGGLGAETPITRVFAVF